MLPHKEQLTATKSVPGTGGTTASASDASVQRGETLCARAVRGEPASGQRGETLCARARPWRARDTHQSGIGVAVACRCSQQREKPAQGEQRDGPPRALQLQPQEGSSRDLGTHAEQSLRPPRRLALLPTARRRPGPIPKLPQPRAASHAAPAGEGAGGTLIFSTRWALPREARDSPTQKRVLTRGGSKQFSLSAIRPRKRVSLQGGLLNNPVLSSPSLKTGPQKRQTVQNARQWQPSRSFLPETRPPAPPGSAPVLEAASAHPGPAALTSAGTQHPARQCRRQCAPSLQGWLLLRAARGRGQQAPLVPGSAGRRLLSASPPSHPESCHRQERQQAPRCSKQTSATHRHGQLGDLCSKRAVTPIAFTLSRSATFVIKTRRAHSRTS